MTFWHTWERAKGEGWTGRANPHVVIRPTRKGLGSGNNKKAITGFDVFDSEDRNAGQGKTCNYLVRRNSSYTTPHRYARPPNHKGCRAKYAFSTLKRLHRNRREISKTENVNTDAALCRRCDESLYVQLNLSKKFRLIAQ